MAVRSWLRGTLRTLNVVVALVSLASAGAVLVSDLLEPGYQQFHRDALWFVTAYVVAQAVVGFAFARDTWLVPWLATLKTVLAYAFLATFVAVGNYWIAWTPGRYVYQLFDWNEGSKLSLFAFVFLGRGAWNTLNALYFTARWWRPLRARRPLLGRLVTAVPLALVAFLLWAFLELVRYEAETFSAEAHDVARAVFDGLDCDAIRAHQGKETTDVRQQGEHRYQVRIAYDCAYTAVLVRAEDGRQGTMGAPRRECCAPLMPPGG